MFLFLVFFVGFEKANIYLNIIIIYYESNWHRLEL